MSAVAMSAYYDLTMYKQLTRQNLGRVFNSRGDRVCVTMNYNDTAKLLGSILFDSVFPELVFTYLLPRFTTFETRHNFVRTLIF